VSGEEEPVAWLRAQVEARKALAEAATPGPWEPEGDDPTDDEVYIGLDDDSAWRVAILRGPESHENMLHVAANDPRDVIARCEAELAILDEHEMSWPDQTPEYEYRDEVLTDSQGGAHYVHVKGNLVPPYVCKTCGYGFNGGPCRTVRLLAGGYRHRPGFPAALAALDTR